MTHTYIIFIICQLNYFCLLLFQKILLDKLESSKICPTFYIVYITTKYFLKLNIITMKTSLLFQNAF